MNTFKEHPDAFSLQLRLLRNATDTKGYVLVLEARGRQEKRYSADWNVVWNLSSEQVLRIIDALAEDGLFERAIDLTKVEIKPPNGPGCMVLVYCDTRVRLYEFLEQDATMSRRLEALGKALDGKAAEAMDKLVAQFERHRKEREKEAAVANAPAIAWGEAANGLRFRIWTDKQRYEEGEDIWLHAEYQNTNDEGLVIRVNYTPGQFPQQALAPLYSLRLFLNHQREEGGAFSSTIELLPIPSSMFWITPDLRKLPAGQTYEEECRLDSGFWSGTGTAPGYVLEPGRYTIHAAYPLRGLAPLTKRQEEKLRELGAQLWEGHLLSNIARFEVRPGD